MPYRRIFLYPILVLLALTFAYVVNAQTEEKVNLSIGFGIPEAINIGIGYDMDPVVLGLSIGTFPSGSDESVLSLVADIRYHFAGSSDISYRRPWYGDVGINYLRDETETEISKYSFLVTRVGREFNIDYKWGIYLTLGAIIELSEEEIKKERRSGIGFDLDWPVLPSLGIGVFYKI